MAKENVRKFYEKLESSKELQEKLVKAQESYIGDKADREAVLETVLLPIAKEAGYDFTISEYKNAQREAMAEKGMSEEELENVSGGGSFCFLIGFGKYIGACSLIGECVESDDNADDEGTLTAGVGFTGCRSIGFGVGGYF